MKPVAWLDRTFTFDLPLEAFPALRERLATAPARAAELVRGVDEPSLEHKPNGRWSVKEHIGHLCDLHALDDRRLREFLAGATVLAPADVTNAATDAADHNHVAMAVLLERFRAQRVELTRTLGALTAADVARAALHPRLQRPMRLLDWAHFVAEHDDHHLTAAAGILACELSG